MSIASTVTENKKGAAGLEDFCNSVRGHFKGSCVLFSRGSSACAGADVARPRMRLEEISLMAGGVRDV